NKQLLFYAATYAALAPKAKGVNVYILQPWAGGNSHWYVDATTLKQFMDEAIAAQQKVLNKDTTFGPSDSCTFCPANPHSRGDKGRPLCPTMMDLLYPDRGANEDEILSL